MIVETNKIVVKNSFKNIQLDLNTYKKINQDLVSKYNLSVELLSKKSTAVNFPFILETYLETLLETTELNTIASFVSDSNPFAAHHEEDVIIIDVIEDDDGEEVEVEEEAVVETQLFNYELPMGWSMFSIPLDLTQIIMTHDYMDGKSAGDVINFTTTFDGFALFLKNHLYKNIDDEIPLFYSNSSQYTENLLQAKNYSGRIYWPLYDFNAIGPINNIEGYQIKIENQPHYLKVKSVARDSINNLNLTTSSSIASVPASYYNGWTMIGFQSLGENINAMDYIRYYLDADQVVIMKNYNGAVIMPEYEFNGIGKMTPGQGYQIKFKNM
tara:strand:+ start:7245 stop:8225 length:981 start_codon:yes stop_codon:yes gene_type:complete